MVLETIQIDPGLTRNLGVHIKDALLCWVVKKVCKSFGTRVTRVLILTKEFIYLSNLKGELCRVFKVEALETMYFNGNEFVLTTVGAASEPSLYLEVMLDRRNNPSADVPHLADTLERILGRDIAREIPAMSLKNTAKLDKTPGYKTPVQKMEMWRREKKRSPTNFKRELDTQSNSPPANSSVGYSQSSPALPTQSEPEAVWDSPTHSQSLPALPPHNPPPRLADYYPASPGTIVRPAVSAVPSPMAHQPQSPTYANSFSHPPRSRVSPMPHHGVVPVISYTPQPPSRSMKGQILVTCTLPTKCF